MSWAIACASGDSSHLVAQLDSLSSLWALIPAPTVSKTNSAGLTSGGGTAPCRSKYGMTACTGPKLSQCQLEPGKFGETEAKLTRAASLRKTKPIVCQTERTGKPKADVL